MEGSNRIDNGWKQERIAKAKDVAQNTVAWRLKLHDETSEKTKESICQGLIEEGHLYEIIQLSVNRYLSNWMSTEEIRQELIDRTITHVKKNGKKTTKAVRKDVGEKKKLIKKVDELYNSFDEKEKKYIFKEKDGEIISANGIEFDARKEFLKNLKENNVRNISDASFYAHKIKEELSDNLEKYKIFIEGKSNEKKKDSEKNRKIAELREKFLNKDALEVIDDLKDKSVKLLLVDPPYGAEYQSNRRWKSKKRDKIKGDTKDESLFLIEEMLKKIKSKMEEDAHLLIFINSKQLCNVRKIICENGFSHKGELIWVKEEHGTGDLKGTFAPQHEYIIHATVGRPEVSPRKPTVFKVAREDGANPVEHPTKKPVELLKQFIESTTHKGDLVVDPFAGVGSTLIASFSQERDFWGCEINQEYWEKGMNRLIMEVSDEVI